MNVYILMMIVVCFCPLPVLNRVPSIKRLETGYLKVTILNNSEKISGWRQDHLYCTCKLPYICQNLLSKKIVIVNPTPPTVTKK